jgi:ABC-type uncharacterized transport system permease subunit
MDTTVLIELLAASVRIATPLLFVALGGVLSENAGTFAVGLEGMMLMGAFGGAVATFVTKNVAAWPASERDLWCGTRRSRGRGYRKIPSRPNGHRTGG